MSGDSPVLEIKTVVKSVRERYEGPQCSQGPSPSGRATVPPCTALIICPTSSATVLRIVGGATHTGAVMWQPMRSSPLRWCKRSDPSTLLFRP